MASGSASMGDQLDDYDSGLADVRFHSWSEDPEDAPRFSNPMHWVRLATSDPQRQIDQTLEALSDRPYRDRVIHLWHPMDGVMVRRDMVRMLTEGYYIEPLRSKFFEFYEGIANAGLRLYRAVADFEGGLHLWGMEETEKLAMLNEVYSSPAAVGQLPPELQPLGPEDYASGHPNRNTTHNIWSEWASHLRSDACRQVFYEAQQYYYGDDAKCTNYADAWRDFPVTYANNRISTSSTGVSLNESAPVLYLLNRLNRYNDLQAATGVHWRWIRFLDKLNEIRSSVNLGECSPWVSPVGYQRLHDKWNLDTPFLDAQLVGHAILLGCYDFHYWNPGPPSQFPDPARKVGNDAYSAIIHEVEPYRKPYYPDWQPIEVSEKYIPSQVETFGFTTTYEDYLKYKNPDI